MAVTVELEGSNIIEHLQKTSKMRDETHRHFYFNSKLFRAIYEHILSKKCILIIPPADHSIPCHRGTGPSIHFKDAFVYVGGTHINIAFTVGYIDNENEHMDYPPEREIKYDFSFPIEMELNFKQKDFDAHVKEIADKRENYREKEQLKKLMHKYPEEAKKLLKG